MQGIKKILLLLSILYIAWYFYKVPSSLYRNSFKKEAYFEINLNGSSENKLLEFFIIHENILQEKNASVKKITFNETPIKNGYGNQIYSFISSFLIAILTDSQLVLKNNIIKDFISFPLNVFDNITVQEGLQKSEFKTKIHLFETKQAWKANKNIDKLTKTSVTDKPYMRYIFKAPEAFFMEICANPAYFYKLFYYGLAKAETLNSALQVINEKEKFNYKEKANLFLNIGFEVGGNILNKVWIPNVNMSNLIDFYLKKEFEKNYVIGIQIRNEYVESKTNNDLIKFINCAIQIENSYLKSAENFKKIKWFITSDKQSYIDYIVKKHPDKSFATKGKLEHASEHSNGYLRAVLDNELLSKCDEIIITAGSTFGFVSAMKMLKLPFYIIGKAEPKICSRASLDNELVQFPDGMLFKILRFFGLFDGVSTF